MTPSLVRIGQVYRDRDKRMSGGDRYVLVMDVAEGKAKCHRAWRRESGPFVWYNDSPVAPARIRLDRLTSSRFELVEDVT